MQRKKVKKKEDDTFEFEQKEDTTCCGCFAGLFNKPNKKKGALDELLEAGAESSKDIEMEALAKNLEDDDRAKYRKL